MQLHMDHLTMPHSLCVPSICSRAAYKNMACLALYRHAGNLSLCDRICGPSTIVTACMANLPQTPCKQGRVRLILALVVGFKLESEFS